MIVNGQRLLQMTPTVVTPMVSTRMTAFGLSYGLSEAGYDIRLAQKVELEMGFTTLGSSLERFQMPTDMLARVCDKSTLIRMGVRVGNTVIEPGWEGWLTLELTYAPTKEVFEKTGRNITLAEGMPIAQVLWEPLAEARAYTGKYNNQPNRPVPSIFETGTASTVSSVSIQDFNAMHDTSQMAFWDN